MTAQKNRGLGRGLDAIFGTTNPTQQSKPMSEMAEIAIADIEPNPLQPRSMFDEEALKELSESIAQLGVIQPITLKRRNDGRYTIISGERRWRAAQMAGVDRLPAYIREVEDEDLHAMALVENIQRQDLNAIEIALGMQRLIEECGLTQEAMAEKVGKKRSTVSNYMRLLALPSEVQLALKEGIISMGHAKAIAGLDGELQLKALKRCIKKSLSVRQAEMLAKKMSEKARNINTEVEDEYPESYSRLVVEFERVLSENIAIKRTKSGSCRITIECANDTEVDKLIAKLGKIK
ncbi:MAG: ParB/RepB/Spo0J family partition protein [Alistipes sp.]|nr:ParB/RepB/Spo0J family partition protein [Alistipes sp.]